jgi:flagellar protein FliO/FliZ
VLVMLLRLVFSLGLVLVLMAVLARFLQRRQLGGRASGAGAAKVQVRVLARHGLGRTSSVTVVDVAGQVLLLGVTEQSIQVLREFSDEQLAAHAAAAETPAAAPITLPGLPSLANLRVPALPGLRPALDALRERTLRRG